MTFSREGWVLAFFGGLALSAFLRSYIPLALFTSIAFLSLPILAVIWTLLALRGIEIRRDLPEEGISSEYIYAVYRIAGHSFLPAFGVRFEDNATRGFITAEEMTTSGGLALRKASSPVMQFLELLGLVVLEETDLFEEAFHSVGIQSDFPVPFPTLWRGRWYERTIPVRFPVRGKYRVGPGKIIAGDPLGIFKMSVEVSGFGEILILPNWSTLERFPVGGSSRILRDENIPREQEGSSPEFLGVREYHPGDPLKTVHWKLTARHRRLMVKQFVQQVESSWGIILDLRKGTNAGKGTETTLEYMVSITAAILERFDEEKVPHALILAADDMTIRESMRGERVFPDELRLIAACKNDGFMPLYERSLNLVGRYPQMSWIIITARKDKDIINSIEALSSYGGTALLTEIDINSFLSEDVSGELLTKWRQMWGEELKDFEMAVLSLGASLYQVHRGDNLSMVFY